MSRQNRLLSSWRLVALSHAVLATTPSVTLAVGDKPVLSPSSLPTTGPSESVSRELATARKLVAAGSPGEAREHFQDALRNDPRNTAGWIEYGDALLQYSLQDPSALQQAVSVWDRALQDAPENMAVLKRIEAAERRAVKFYPNKGSVARLREVSLRVLSREPKDLNAQVDSNIAKVTGWFFGIDSGGPEVTKAVEALLQLRTLAGDDSDIPYFVASAYIKRAQEAAAAPGAAEAAQVTAKLAEAASVFEDALHDHPNDPALVLRYAQVLRTAQRVVATPGHEAAAKKYDQIIGELVTNLKPLVKPEALGYTELQVLVADTYLRSGDAAKAEELLRDLVSRRPTDQSARVALASLLHTNPANRAEAIDLLKKPVVDPGQIGVTQLWSHATLENQTALDLTKYLIEQYYTVTDASRRKQIKSDLSRSLDALAAYSPEQPETLKQKARVMMLDGGTDAAVAAIPVIDKAIANLKALNGGNPDAKPDWDLLFMLARCYIDTQQSGEARKLLWKITEGVPTYAPARALLTQLLLETQETDLAAEQLAALEKLTPADPSVKRLQMTLMIMTGKRDEVLKLLKDLPESTMEQRKAKAQVAVAAREPTEAKRLLTLILETTPGDYEAVDALARLLWQDGEKQKATDLVAAAAEAAPENARLKILLSQFRGDKPEVILAETVEAIKADPDPLSRELKFFDLYAPTDALEALKHLDAAEKINPEHARVLDVRFQLAVNGKKWEEGQRYAAKLGAINADQAHGLIYGFRLAMAQGDLDEAWRLSEDMMRTLPQYARSWLSRAAVEQARGKFEAATTSYAAALERQTESIDAIRGLIECNDALHRPEDVRRYLDRAIQLHPENSTFRDQRLQWDMVYGKPADAITKVTAARDAAPDNLQVWLKVGVMAVQAARQAAAAGHAGDAQTYAKQAHQAFAATRDKWPDEKLPYAYIADLAEFTRDFADGEAALTALANRDAYKNSAEPLVLLAEYELRTGKPGGAETALQEAVKRSNGDTSVRMQLSRFYASQNQFDKALAQLDESSGDLQILRQRVETLVAAGRAPDAGILLDKLIIEHPKDVLLLLTRSWLLLNTNHPTESRAAAAEALKLEPNNPQAQFYIGQAALRQSPPKLEDAVTALVAARNLVPANLQYHQYLAEAYRLSGDNDRLATELLSIVKLDPLNRFIRGRLVETYTTLTPPKWDDAIQLISATATIPQLSGDPEWPNMEASIWRARNEPIRAMEKARQTLAMVARLSPEQAAKDSTYRQNALSVFRWAKQYQPLLDACDELLKDPTLRENAWWIFSFRAAANHSLGHDKEAETDFDTALRITSAAADDSMRLATLNDLVEIMGIDTAIRTATAKATPDQPRWQISVAYLYLRKGDIAKATAAVEVVLANQSKLTANDSAAALDTAGVIYMQSKNYSKAVETYEALAVARPANITALNNLACLYSELAQPPRVDKALVYSQKAVDLASKNGPVDPNLLDTHGWVLVLNGKAAEGVKVLQNAVDRQPFPEAYYHLALALRATGASDPAAVALLKAKELLNAQKAMGQPVSPELEQKIVAAIAVSQPK